MTESKEYKRNGYRNPIPTVDIIIEYNDGRKQGIVLIERRNPPHGLAIPGGFAEYGLSLEENAIKEAREETGLEVIIQNPEQPLCVHSAPERDPRAHIISNTYIAQGRGQLQAGDDAQAAQVYTLAEVQQLIAEHELVFDHARALQKYLDYRKSKL